MKNDSSIKRKQPSVQGPEYRAILGEIFDTKSPHTRYLKSKEGINIPYYRVDASVAAASHRT